MKAEGLWDDTIILPSDHGYHLGDHFLWGKVTLFDIGTRVPFLMHAPGVSSPGTTSEAMVELIDIFPTLLELVAHERPDGLQGVSIAPLLQDPQRTGSKTHSPTPS